MKSAAAPVTYQNPVPVNTQVIGVGSLSFKIRW